MMRATVDTNSAETSLLQALQERLSCEVEHRPLHLGDVELVRDIDGGVERLVIERKSFADWASSVQGGRYREQKTRWLTTRAEGAARGERAQFLYIIEGALAPMGGSTRGMANKALNAAMIKTELRDGIPVLRSTDKRDTAEVCVYIAERFAKGELSAEAATETARNVVVGLGDRSKRKRENLEDPKLLLSAMLTCVPGMSAAKAEALVEAYPTVGALRAASVQQIADVKHKARRMGEAVGGRIAAFFGSG